MGNYQPTSHFTWLKPILVKLNTPNILNTYDVLWHKQSETPRPLRNCDRFSLKSACCVSECSSCHCSASVALWKHSGDKHNCETSLFVCWARCCLCAVHMLCIIRCLVQKKSLPALTVNTQAAVGMLNHSFLLLTSKTFIFSKPIKQSDRHHRLIVLLLTVISTKLWKQEKQVKMIIHRNLD